MPTFRTTRRVEFADTDMAGIAHFSAFFRWMEAAEHEFLRSRGLSVVLEWQGEKLGFPRVSASCDYLRPVRFEDVVEITVTPSRIGGKSISYSFECFLGEELVAKGAITCVCCRVYPEKKMVEAIPIPEDIRTRLGSEEGT